MSEEETEKMTTLRRGHSQLESDSRPIVLEYNKRKKKKAKQVDEGKEKYSTGLEDIQRMEGDVMRITQKAVRAVSKGIDTYEHERQRSAKEKKDGAIEDFIYNSGKAVSASLKEASDIPIDLAESLNSKSYRMRLRRNLRQASRFIRMWRL